LPGSIIYLSSYEPIGVSRSGRVSDQQEIERAALEEVLRQMPAAVMIVEAPSGETILVNRETQQMSERYLGRSELSGVGDLRDLHDT
jgi:hypothetical protein